MDVRTFGPTELGGDAHLQLPCHRDHIVIRWIVLVAVGEHESDVAGELLSVSVLSTVHLSLMKV